MSEISAHNNTDFRDLLEGRIESEEYVRRLRRRVDEDGIRALERRGASPEFVRLARRRPSEGPQHFIVGFVGGLLVGLLLPIAAGWWLPL